MDICLVKSLTWSYTVCVYLCTYSCRPVYVSAVRPQSKHIVVMIDHGASIADTQLQIAKDSALVILNAIDEHDKVCGREQIDFFLIKEHPYFASSL